LRLSESMLNTIVKNCEEIVSKVCWVWTFLQALGITETFATGETGICACCMVQASM
jgi:hypothetical protein